MTYAEYSALVAESRNYQTAEEFLAEYGYPADCQYTEDELVKVMWIIFAVGRNDYYMLHSTTGRTHVCEAAKYNIPVRTIQNWTNKDRTPLAYVTELIGYAEISDKQGYIFARASVSRPQPKGSHTQQ